MEHMEHESKRMRESDKVMELFCVREVIRSKLTAFWGGASLVVLLVPRALALPVPRARLLLALFASLLLVPFAASWALLLVLLVSHWALLLVRWVKERARELRLGLEEVVEGLLARRS